MAQHLIDGLKRFGTDTFPRLRDRYERLVNEGQNPSTLFIACADSRVLPDRVTDTGPGDLFVVRNVGAFVPPFDPDGTFDGTGAGIEFAVLGLGVKHIVVCGHSHCGAVRTLYDPPNPSTPHINRWLELGREARVGDEPTEDALRAAERRSIALQVGRLAGYPCVAERLEAGALTLHGWHYIIEDGQVQVLDPDTGTFGPLP